MSLESEIKKLTEAINRNTDAFLQANQQQVVPVTVAPAPVETTTTAAPAPPSAPVQDTPPAPPVETAPPAPPAQDTPPAPAQTISAEELNAAMVEKATAMGDNGAACMKILTDMGVSGIAQLTDQQRVEAFNKIGEL